MKINKLLAILALFYFAFACTPQNQNSSLSPFPNLENREGLYFKQKAEEPFTGLSESFYNNGNSYVKASFKEGKLHGTYTGYNSDGSKMGETEYANGKKHGCSIAWHPNGHKASEIYYLDNQKKGKLKIFYPTGDKSTEAFFKNDQLDSTFTRWDMDGNVISVEVYEEGVVVE